MLPRVTPKLRFSTITSHSKLFRKVKSSRTLAHNAVPQFASSPTLKSSPPFSGNIRKGFAKLLRFSPRLAIPSLESASSPNTIPGIAIAIPISAQSSKRREQVKVK